MTAKILCPWCGTEMRSVLELVRSRTGRNIAWNAHMRCPNWDCQAEGPFMQIPPFVMKENADEKLRAATLRRYNPPIKPMTMEEAFEHTVNVELKDGGRVRRITLPVAARMARAIEIFVPRNISQEDAIVLPHDNYGKTWRCWERKPTDEERSAAEWET